MPASKRQKTKAAKPVELEKKKSVQPLKCDICKQVETLFRKLIEIRAGQGLVGLRAETCSKFLYIFVFQLLNSDALKMYGGDSPDSVEEFIALASESLSLFDAESNGT